MSEKENNKPMFERRLGHCRVAVWENQTSEGRKWFNVAITRRYKSGDDWKETATFNGLGDLALVSECVSLAKSWIASREGQSDGLPEESLAA